jgi:hypothetical protein
VVYDRLAVGADLQIRLDAVAPGNRGSRGRVLYDTVRGIM